MEYGVIISHVLLQNIEITPTDRSVQPRLVASAVWEPTVGAAHSDIENKIECC